MRLQTFLPTRVARRMVGLFVACVVLPAALLAGVAYLQVSRHLQRQASIQLDEQARAAGQSLIERLLLATAELSRIAAGVPDSVARPAGLEPRTVDLLRVAPADSVPGGLTPALAGRLAAGRPVLVTEPSSGEILIAAEYPTPSGRERLIGRANPERLFGTEEAGQLVPSTLEICVSTRSQLLHCSDGGSLPEDGEADESLEGGGLGWTAPGGAEMIGAQWEAFLGFEFGSPNWRVTISRPAKAVLAPLQSFRTTFWLLTLLLVVAAFVAGNVTIRRALAPLDELERGTVRLASGDLTHRIDVATDDEFGALAGSFNVMAASLRRQFGALSALNHVGRTALATPDLEAIARAAGMAAGSMEVGWATLAAPRADIDGPWVAVSIVDESAPAFLLESVPSAGELERLLDGVEHFAVGNGSTLGFLPPRLAESVRHVVFPLRRQGQLSGALVLSENGRPFDEGALAHGRLLANQVGVALANTRLLDDLADLSNGALIALARTVDANSPWTAGHSERVTSVSLALGRRIGLSATELDVIRRGGLLHDIGKIAVPAAVLDKPGTLTAEERAIIERHPVTGARILSPITAFRDVIPLVRWHHEKLDGSGYPDGIGGSEIPFLVRVMTVSDIFDALVSERPYRPAWTAARALSLLQEGRGRQFDPIVVDALADHLATKEPLEAHREVDMLR
ncbi:MAG: HD domain-containing phosphohydrolase [Gemmatimonadales bacterium]